ncbi:MAG: hypothetical protein A2161_06095 [Candidatus Schekmanbacteria bacterium RBG_13_48_7]|uniref:Uncharacterized protein n=1 Tax=Candidatus Schekmanbacteria bacterium RBG_13_48_7 TaxID=1817878 RepID=A0A1F7RPR4_9BACT|nr:MAG: hypothetical protein A2161_06095 [Candidatus Schekmanbacteria bacterium RBG_13_48_7]
MVAMNSSHLASEVVTVPERWLFDRGIIRRTVLLFVLCFGPGIGVAIPLHWQALTTFGVYDHDHRQSPYAVIVFLVFWQSANLDRMIAHIARRMWRVAAMALLVAVLVFSYRNTFIIGDTLRNASIFTPLSRFLSTLPADTLLAGPPRDLDDIVIQSCKPAMIAYLLDHRWYIDLTKELHTRYIAIFDEIYASDPEPINLLHAQYGVTHLLISRSCYGKILKLHRFYSRYDEEVMQRIGKRRNFLLQHPPTKSIIYDDGHFLVIKLPLEVPGQGIQLYDPFYIPGYF